VSPATLLVLALLLAGGLMTVVFALARRIQNYSVVDVAWSLAFTPLALLYAALGTGWGPRRTLMAGLTAAWSLRLGLHLWVRIARHHPREDGRYVELRRLWASHPAVRFFAFFQLQGLLNVILSLPVLLACLHPAPAFAPAELAGAAVFAIAVTGEGLADAQLRRFKADPARRGQVCDVGLWRFSRHPNYFFEWLVWCGFFLLALPAPWGWTTIFAPLLMLYFLLRVTGIPMTEEQSVRTKGAAYREYQRTTSAFFPLPPRRA
jgi:steroid 5-alpha reductase family enzyme